MNVIVLSVLMLEMAVCDLCDRYKFYFLSFLSVVIQPQSTFTVILYQSQHSRRDSKSSVRGVVSSVVTAMHGCRWVLGVWWTALEGSAAGGVSEPGLCWPAFLREMPVSPAWRRSHSLSLIGGTLANAAQGPARAKV